MLSLKPEDSGLFGEIIDRELRFLAEKGDSPKEKLYLDLLTQSQKALRALGMNTDSRERKTDNDGFADFINQFKDEEE